MNKITNNTL